jgi:hypothetical protein
MKRGTITLMTLAALSACGETETATLTAPEPALSHIDRATPFDAAPTRTFDVTVENLTEGGQHLTPPLLAVHRGSLEIFRLGRPATHEIQQIAENGNLGPMISRFENSPHLSSFTVATSGTGLEGPLAPGEAVTVSLTADPGSEFLSFVSMLICTNDGFTGVSGMKLPNRVGEEARIHFSAYDAGTEVNTQDFGDLVPPCPVLSGVISTLPGTGETDPALAEDGVIHLHEGIGDFGGLTPSLHGWTNPVARLKVKRTG